MSLVLSVVWKATALTSQTAYKVGVLDTGFLKVLPEVSPPAALSCG